MSMTLKTTKNLFFGLSVVFKITTRRSTIDVRKKSDLSRKNRTTGPTGHVRKISDQPQPVQLLSSMLILIWQMKRTKFAPVLLYNEVVEGYIGFTLSVCPSVGLSVCPSVPHPVSVRSVAPGQFWLDPFHIYTSYQATSEGVSHVKFLANFVNLNFWQFLSICNFDFVLVWLGIWCESLVWVIMGRRCPGYLRTQAF